MYAIIMLAGKQYMVEPGNTVFVNRLKAKVGEKITISDVLLFNDNKQTYIGRPLVPNVKVIAEVIRHTRGAKIIVFKKKPKKGYKRTYGHRQNLTEIKISSIEHKLAEEK